MISSWLTRMAATPTAVSTAVTVWVATVSPLMEATMVALPKLSAVRVAVGPSPLTEITLLSRLLHSTWVLSLKGALSRPTRVAVAVSPSTMLLETWML